MGLACRPARAEKPATAFIGMKDGKKPSQVSGPSKGSYRMNDNRHCRCGTATPVRRFAFAAVWLAFEQDHMAL